MRGRKWTEDEDNLLRQLVQLHGKQWSIIASKMENRTASQVSSRWEKCIDPSLLKGPFSHEEDQIVIDYVNKHGPSNWPRLAEILKVRSPKQCRERWFNHLDPNLSKESWTREEDLTILEQHTKIGPKWSVISHFLPGRSDNAIKNRWNSSISKRVQYNQSGPPTLLEENVKKSQKSEKCKAKLTVNPIPIPAQQTDYTVRWNVQLTSKSGRNPYPNAIYIPPQQLQPPQLEQAQQMQMQQQKPQGMPQALPQGIMQIPQQQMYQYPPVQYPALQTMPAPLTAQQVPPPLEQAPEAKNIQMIHPQIQQQPQQVNPQVTITQKPIQPQQQPPQTVLAQPANPQQQQQQATNNNQPPPAQASTAGPLQSNPPPGITPKDGQLFSFNPFGAPSTPLSFDIFSPTSPSAFNLFQSPRGSLLSPHKPSDRYIFK